VALDLTETELPSPAAADSLMDPMGVRQDGSWIAVMAALASIEIAWWAVAWYEEIAPTPFIATYLSVAFAALAIALVLRLALRKTPSGAAWPTILAGTLLVAIGASVFLPLKYAIPREMPFWLDHWLAVAEESLFGTDPWLALDRVFWWAAQPLDRLYGGWLPFQLIIMFLVMLSRPSPEKSRSLIAYSLAWFLLGVVAAFLLSSVGPLFYSRAFGGDTFASLGATLRERGAWIALSESDQMWESLASGRPGLVAGISAMPSIHVAISLWIVLTARTMKPRAAGAAWVYFALVWIASVQLGWHYVSDGLVGAFGMVGVWMLAGIVERTLRPRAQPTECS
jgi:hypothetical protein